MLQREGAFVLPWAAAGDDRPMKKPCVATAFIHGKDTTVTITPIGRPEARVSSGVRVLLSRSPDNPFTSRMAWSVPE